MTAAAVRADALVAATIPYALFALAQHMLDFPHLGYPLDVEVPGHAGKPITLWVRPEHAHDWCSTAITVDGPVTERDSIVGVRRTVHGTLHGACIRVRILWTIPVVLDHEPCTDPDCDRTICFCNGSETLGPCQNTVARGCPHLGEILCEEHRLDCSECRQDLSDDRAESWSQR